MNDRVTGERLPKLKPNFIPLVHTAWAAPTDFGNAIKSQIKSEANAFTLKLNSSHLRFILPLLGMMAIATVFQIWLSDRPTQFYDKTSASLAIQMTHHSGYAIQDVTPPATIEPDLDQPIRITLEVNGDLLLDETYTAQDNHINQGARIFEQIFLPVGKHHVTVKMYDLSLIHI